MMACSLNPFVSSEVETRIDLARGQRGIAAPLDANGKGMLV